MHICGYVPAGATQQTGQRTNKVVDVFFAEALRKVLVFDTLQILNFVIKLTFLES